MNIFLNEDIRLLGSGAILIAIFLFLGSITTVEAAEVERRIEEETRRALEQTESRILKNEQRLVFDYGGWINFRYSDYDNDDNDTSTSDTFDYTESVDFRFWMKAVLRPPVNAPYENEHFFYLRLKDLNIVRRPEDTAGGSDHDGPHVDYAYLILDLRPCWLKVGRRYFSVGQGIAYSDVHDGAEVAFLLPKWRLKGFVSHTLPHEDNIDISVPGYSKGSDRYFYGLEYKYLGIPGQNLYGYLVFQRDYSDEYPEDSIHNYTYDSEYTGLGIQGEAIKNLSYHAEIIRESGRSYVFENNDKKDIDAWAGVCGIDYDLQTYSHPTFSFEYAFGSGDSDRTSVTDTQYGNSSGDDKNFLYFGYIPSGYALFPRLSNLHFYKTGVSFNPLEKHPLFKNFKLAVDYYRYYKDKSSGGIYDTEASQSDDDIGSEIDLTIRWQIFSDTSCSLQYGHFIPADAYPVSTKDSEDYFSISMAFTF